MLHIVGLDLTGIPMRFAYEHGAVAVGAMIFNFIYWGFGFLKMGTTGFTAQAWGRRDGDEVRAGLSRGWLLRARDGAALLAAAPQPGYTHTPNTDYPGPGNVPPDARHPARGNATPGSACTTHATRPHHHTVVVANIS